MIDAVFPGRLDFDTKPYFRSLDESVIKGVEDHLLYVEGSNMSVGVVTK